MRQTCGFSHRTFSNKSRFALRANRFCSFPNNWDRATMKKTDLPNAGLRLLVRTQFQDLFHSPSGVLFAFPSRYLFAIDRKVYLALEGGPSGFGQGFTCPGLLEKTDIRAEDFRLRGFHPLWRSIPTPSTNLQLFYLTR